MVEPRKVSDFVNYRAGDETYSLDNPEAANYKIANVKTGDRIAVCVHIDNGVEYPIHAFPIKANTIKSVMDTLAEVTRYKLTKSSQFNVKYGLFTAGYIEVPKFVYSKIAEHNYLDRHSEYRMKTVKDFEEGDGVPIYHLYGTYNYFEGFRKRGRYLYPCYGS
jgi:hypothetical protein